MIRVALRYPAFRWMLSALAISQVSDWLYNLALIVLVYDRTHSTLWTRVTTAARVAVGAVVLAYALVVLRPAQAALLAGARPSRNEI
jgi:hypothetical protein